MKAAPGVSRSRLLAAHEEAVRFYRAQLAGNVEPGAYLAGRGLPDVAGQDRWSLGYALPEWVALVSHLRDRGYVDREIEVAGLAVRSRGGRLVDRFRDRIMVPLRDAAGAVVGFLGRDITDSAGVPKYLNSPETPLFRKSAVLFGLAEQHDLAAGPAARRLIVEGPLDVLAVAEAQPGDSAARVVAVAACGTALTAQHVELLAAGGGSSRPLTLAFDPDPAGRAAADRAYQLLQRWPAAVDALELAADPADLLRDRGAAAARVALCSAGRPLLDTVIDHKLAPWAEGIAAGWAETRVAALRAVAPLVATGQRPGEFTRRVAALAVRLDLDPVAVNAAVLDVLVVRDQPDGPGRQGRSSAALAAQTFPHRLHLPVAEPAAVTAATAARNPQPHRGFPPALNARDRMTGRGR